MTERPVQSPCISICALDENDVCSGCFRTVEEITRWSRMTESERLRVVVLAAERSRKNNPFAL
jgi:uncharacterized protein